MTTPTEPRTLWSDGITALELVGDDVYIIDGHDGQWGYGPVEKGVKHLVSQLDAALAERDTAHRRLRTTAQLLIAEVGSDGPENAEEVAYRAIVKLQTALADAAAMREDAELGRLLRERRVGSARVGDGDPQAHDAGDPSRALPTPARGPGRERGWGMSARSGLGIGEGVREPFDRIDPRGMVATRVTYYAALYPKLREVAYQHGYALALHGPLTNNLDVVAVPWTEEAKPEEELVVALCERAAGLIAGPPQNPTPKPHGRQAWTILLGSNGGYIDLSVMPRAVPPTSDAAAAGLGRVG